MAEEALAVGNTMVKSPFVEDLSDPNASTTQDALDALRL